MSKKKTAKKKNGWHEPGCQFSKRSMDEAMKRAYEGHECEDSPKQLKTLGYCPTEGCGCSITDSDYVENRKTMMECIRCNKIVRKNKLLSEDPKKIIQKKKKKRLTYLDKVVPPEKHRVFDSSHTAIPEKFAKMEFVDA